MVHGVLFIFKLVKLCFVFIFNRSLPFYYRYVNFLTIGHHTPLPPIIEIPLHPIPGINNNDLPIAPTSRG